MKLKVVQPNDPQFLGHAFDRQKLTTEQVERLDKLNGAGKHAADIILTYCPGSPERTLAIRNVQEAVMWATQSILLTEDYSQEG